MAYPSSPASWLSGHRPAWTHDPLAFLDAERQRHGGAFRFRLGPQNLLVVSDGPSADAILRSSASSFAKPSLLSRFGATFFGRAITALDGRPWLERRGAIQKSLAGAARPHVCAPDPARLDGDVVHRLADLFTAAFARWLLCVDPEDTGEHASSIVRSIDALDEHIAGGIPWPSWVPLRRVRTLRREHDRQRTMVDEWTRRAPAAAPLIAALAPFDRETRLDNINIAVGLGAHQTALAATWTLLELSRHPAFQGRIARETAPPAGRPDAASCAVLESLRLHPPFYAIVRRALTDVDLPCGHVPRGTTVMVSVHLLHRDPAAFDEPDTFLPDRWTSVERPDTFLPFGAGPRACIARHLLVPFLSDFVREIVRHHEVRPPRVDPAPRVGAVLRFKDPVDFAFVSRRTHADYPAHEAHAG